MTKLENKQMELLKDVLFLEQDELHRYSKSFLEAFYKKDEMFEAFGEGIYCSGDIPVLLVAHMDTVHLRKPTEATLYHDTVKDVMWCPDGIGADCRVGVFNIFDILSRGYKPHVMLTWDEERGGVGVSKLMTRWGIQNYSAEALLVQEAMSEVNFAVQLDRQGYSEAVYYSLDNQDFEDYITSFGYFTDIGSYTDICEICPEFGFAGVNVSAGYVNEHRNNELLLVEEMLETQRKVTNILDDQIKKSKFFEYKERPLYSYGRFSGGSLSGWDHFDPTSKTFKSGEEYFLDDVSQDEFYFSEATDTSTDDSTKFSSAEFCHYCQDNISEGTNWAPSVDPYQSPMCFSCRKELWGESADIQEESKTK